MPLDVIDILDDRFASRSAREVFAYAPGWGLPRTAECDEVARVMKLPPPRLAA